MYINFWYPMALSEEVTNAPIQSKALDQNFVLFRDSQDNPHCLSDVCAHRGGSLAMGKFKEDCIECPYHGWRYNSVGQCIYMPTIAEESKLPSRARVDSYPVEEIYGLVFAFLGDLPEGERPPIMQLPQWGEAGWSVTKLEYDWQANFERVIENGLDATHTEFVHPSAGLEGNFDPSKIIDQKLIKSLWGSAYWMDTPGVEIEHGHHGPAHQWTFLSFKSKQFEGNFRFYSYIRPLDQHSVRRYLFHARDFQLGEKMDKELVKTTLLFEQEDRPVIEAMRPYYSPRDRSSELLLPEDEIMLSYRRYLDAWQTKGWHIDIDTLKKNSDRKIFVIPSPMRHKHKNWVQEAVPLLQA
ncbi:MAG: aromatic ring-hydroxylating dioxygenase subunit alpha [Pseudomonadota bacterium]|nr:aromatic ring-hydroxylating dioxygenase subunit alpha [Pseudomonadota bacterium]